MIILDVWVFDIREFGMVNSMGVRFVLFYFEYVFYWVVLVREFSFFELWLFICIVMMVIFFCSVW